MAYVNPLDPTTPLGSDAVSQGDDMFRSVKAALIERMDSFFTGHDVQPWQAKSGSGAASLWIVSDAVEAVTRLAYTGAGSRSVELFANSTVAGLRDTTGPLTILSYTYSSALTVLNTTGSMQLKVGVGQTIQTIVNGVTIGTWSAAGVTIASGTLTLGATAAAAGLIRLPNQNTISWRSAANNDDLRLWVNFNNVLVFDNASGGTPQAISVGPITATTITGTNTGPGSFKFGDAAFSDGVISMYGNADTQNILAIKSSAAYSTNTGKAIIVETNLGALVFTVAGNGAITTAGGLTVSAGGLTVASGTTSLQAATATTITTTDIIRNDAYTFGFAMGNVLGVRRLQWNPGITRFQFVTSGNAVADLEVGALTATTVNTAVGTTNALQNVQTTMFTLPVGTAGRWLVAGNLPGSAAGNAFFAIVESGLNGATFALLTTSISGAITALAIDNSGNFKVTQSGAAQLVGWSYTRLA